MCQSSTCTTEAVQSEQAEAAELAQGNSLVRKHMSYTMWRRDTQDSSLLLQEWKESMRDMASILHKQHTSGMH